MSVAACPVGTVISFHFYPTFTMHKRTIHLLQTTMFRVLTIVALCTPLSTASAQLRQDTVTYALPYEVVVTAPRFSTQMKDIPFATSIVNEQTLRALPRGMGFEEPMLLVPGVKVDNQANGSRIHLSIRGQGILSERGVRGIRILQDGIPMNDPTGFAPDLYDVDYGIVERMEVLRGPAASLYGGSASGGIVNLVTRSTAASPFFGEASGVFGSNNFRRGSAVTGGSGSGLSYLASLSRAMGDGYRDHTHFQGDNAYVKLRYAPAETVELTPLFGWTHYYHENPEGINLQQYNENPLQANPDAIPYNEYLATDRSTFGVNGAWRSGEMHEVRFTAYAKTTTFVEANNRTFTHRDITGPGATAQYTLRCGASGAPIRNTLGVGADMQWQRIEEHRNRNLYAVEDPVILSSERINQSGLGVFLLDRVELGSAWSFLLSLRSDKITNEVTDFLNQPYDLSGSADFHRVTARVGATYAFAKDLVLFAAWGQGFLPPATEELAQNPDHFGGFNTHLVPATSNSFELGTRGQCTQWLGHELTLFYLTTDNDFDRYRITDPARNQETFYRNIGASERIGAELAATISLMHNLDLRLAYTWSRFTYSLTDPVRVMMDDTTIQKYITDGKLLPNCPEHQLSFDVEYRPYPFLTVGASALMMSKSYIDGANIDAEAVAAYTLVNARIACHGSFAGIAGELSLNARNIADTKYVAFSEPDPGGNAYQPGAGREFFGGLRVRL
jgi:iron complex outermembrane recepter protein